MEQGKRTLHAWLLGITPAEYRRLEQGEAWPSGETFDRICKLFGWPQTFATGPGLGVE